MSSPGSDPARSSDPDYRLRRRQIIRENHPDHGGRSETMNAALARLDAEFGTAARRDQPTAFVRTRSRRRRWRRFLPRWVPGSVRYIDI
ncbi:MAG: hypothetical protein C0482_00310 [Gordonia sp.]|nr:hypothetical protein [Gordonia sp. (in: high G+C Gram-positive bacteria)]OZG28508.1 hypothetical protein BH683_014055 [Williamsia sp. 1138]